MTEPCTDCSRCPVRDLGQRYAVGDERDPWRRMPVLFSALRGAFGNAMLSHKAAGRVAIEGAMAKHCARARATYGEPCSDERIELCAGLYLDAAQRAASAPEPHASIRFRLAHLLDAELTHDAYRRTRAAATSPLADALGEPEDAA